MTGSLAAEENESGSFDDNRQYEPSLSHGPALAIIGMCVYIYIYTVEAYRMSILIYIYIYPGLGLGGLGPPGLIT